METEQFQEPGEPEDDSSFQIDRKQNANQLLNHLRKVIDYHYKENALSVATAVGCVEMLKIEMVGRLGMFSGWVDTDPEDKDDSFFSDGES